MNLKKVMSVALILTLVLGLGQVFAQMKIGYVDTQRILYTFNDAIEAQKKLETKGQSLQQELQLREKAFNDLQKQTQDEFQQFGSMMADDKKQEKIAAVEAEAQKLQAFQAEKQQELAQLQEDLMKPIREKISAAINLIRTRDEYDLIVDASVLLGANEKYDLTQKVLDQLKTP